MASSKIVYLPFLSSQYTVNNQINNHTTLTTPQMSFLPFYWKIGARETFREIFGTTQIAPQLICRCLWVRCLTSECETNKGKESLCNSVVQKTVNNAMRMAVSINITAHSGDPRGCHNLTSNRRTSECENLWEQSESYSLHEGKIRVFCHSR